MRVWGALSWFLVFVSRALSFPVAFIFEWRARRFELRGVAARRRELLEVVPRGGKVLEVGAGGGATISAGAYAGAPGRFGRIVATEPDVGMRSRLKQRAKEAEGDAHVEVFDAALPHLPFDDGAFDAVVAFMVLSHVADRPRALGEITRVLKPGGKLLLMDHGAHEHKKHAEESQYWFSEWFRFVLVRGHRQAKLEILIQDLAQEPMLEVDFVSRMQTHGIYKEICYGTYTRKESSAEAKKTHAEGHAYGE